MPPTSSKGSAASTNKRHIEYPSTKGLPARVLVALIGSIFATGVNESVLSPLLPDVARSLDSNVNTAALAVSVYGLTVAVAALVLAPISDRFSRRMLMVGGLVVFSLSTMLCALAPTLLVLIVAQAVAGLAAGITIPAAYAYVGDEAPYAHRARILGLVMSGWAIALVIGVPMGAIVGQWLGWRWVFVPIAVGGILAAGMLTRVQERSSAQRAIANLDGTSGGMLETITAGLRARGVPTLIGVTLCLMFGFYGMYTYLGSFLRITFHLGSAGASGFLVVYGLGFATGPVTGFLADRVGKVRALVVALLALAVVLLVLPHADRFILLLLLLIWGALQSLAVTALTALISSRSTTHRGRILALYSFATHIGLMLGSALGGPLWSVGGYKAVGVACGIASIVGALLVLLIHDKLRTKRAC